LQAFVQSKDFIEEDQEPPQACDFRLINPDESPLHAVPKTKRPHVSLVLAQAMINCFMAALVLSVFYCFCLVFPQTSNTVCSKESALSIHFHLSWYVCSAVTKCISKTLVFLEEYSSDGDVFLRCGMCYLRREDEKKAVTRCFEHRSTGPGMAC
jgi:hypothetical protein